MNTNRITRFVRSRRWALLAAAAVGVLAVASGITLANTGGTDDANTKSAASNVASDRTIDAGSRAVLPEAYVAAIESGELGPKGTTATQLIAQNVVAGGVTWNLIVTRGSGGDAMLTLASDPEESGFFAPVDAYCEKSAELLRMCSWGAAGSGSDTTRVALLGTKASSIDRVESMVGDVIEADGFFAVVVQGESRPVNIGGFGVDGQQLATVQIPPVIPDDMPVITTPFRS